MQIHVGKNGVQSGPFSEPEVRAKLVSGEFTAADMGWYEGLPSWQPLGILFPPPAASGVPFSPPFGGANFSPPAHPVTSGAAIASLICGILGFVLFITSLPAVILGHISLSQIKKSGGALKGRGLAISGLVMGYLMMGFFALGIAAALLIPAYNVINQKADQASSMNNCRQIQSALLAYAADNNGLYPDSVQNPVTGSLPTTSNAAFRALIQAGLVQDERIFGCKATRYMPDNNIGTGPAFKEALEPGENHWAMTGGLSNTSLSTIPLVFENPVDATWPPRWNADAPNQPVPGRVWRDRTIIIGLGDTSVSAVKLEGTSGHVTAKDFPNGKNTFTADGVPHTVLTIEER